MSLPNKSSRWVGVDVIRCINLVERTDRREAMLKEFQKVGIPHDKVNFFNAKRSLDGPLVGIYESHRACIREAYEAGAKTLLLFEDDCVFHPGWEKVPSLLLSPSHQLPSSELTRSPAHTHAHTCTNLLLPCLNLFALPRLLTFAWISCAVGKRLTQSSSAA